MSDGGSRLTAELLVDGAVPRHPAISPDGAWVGYVVASMGWTEDAVGALWVAAVDGSSEPKALASGVDRDCVPAWAPDSASLFFGSDRQLHQIRLDGGDAAALTAWRGGISGYLPLASGEAVAGNKTAAGSETAPDGTAGAGSDVVAVVAADEPSAEDERRTAERDDAMVWGARPTCSRLRLLDLRTRQLRTVDGLGDRHIVEIAQRPDGGPLAVLTWATPEIDPGAYTAELHVVDLETGAVRDLGPVELEATAPTWWHVDGHWHLAYLAITPPGSVGGFAVFDITVTAARSPGPRRNLTAGMTACPTGLAQSADGQPLAMFADGLDTSIYRLDPGTQRFELVSGRKGRVDTLTVSRSGEVVAVLASTAREPKDVHAGPPAGRLVRLSDTRPELRGITWGTQERMSYQASDGLELDGLLILPPGKNRPDGPFPLVTMVHGGPYDRHADEFYGGLFSPGQWLAAAGYAVFLPNPRGSSGHGHEFAATVAGRVGLDEWTDIVSGIDLLIADGVADRDRLGIGGYSHGGFMAAWAIGQTNRFKAALMGAGISDWSMQVAAGELGTLEADLGGSCGWEGTGPHRHDQVSPISYASRIRTPVLILHGQDDTNVPIGQATYFHRALTRFGVEHDFVVYPREGHGVRERNHQLDLLRRTRTWFDRWLGDPISRAGQAAD
jgi:dipeptidyl aminopeptidase/acylaminoacyl peptidase